MTSALVRAPHRARPVVAAAGLWALSLVLVAISLATSRAGGPNDPGTAILEGGAALMLTSVGAILVGRLPHHLVGWLLTAGGLLLAISVATSGLADFGLDAHPGSVPGAIWFAWINGWIWAPEIACLFILLPLFYPTGRLPGHPWRAVVAIAIALVVAGGVGSAFSPWIPDPYPVDDPLTVSGFAGDVVSFLANEVGTALVVIGGALAVASLVVRYLRAGAIERAQLRWFAAVATVTACGGIANVAAYSASGTAAPTGAIAVLTTVSGFVIYSGLALLPVAIGLAVLRYRLYEIDRLVSRTISWALMSGVVVSLFVVVVLALQVVLAPLTQSNELAVAGSTLLVAALFQPIRRRVQGLVDRRFNRARYDAERTVAAFASRLADELDQEHLRTAILATVSQTVEPSSVSLWLRR